MNLIVSVRTGSICRSRHGGLSGWGRNGAHAMQELIIHYISVTVGVKYVLEDQSVREEYEICNIKSGIGLSG